MPGRPIPDWRSLASEHLRLGDLREATRCLQTLGNSAAASSRDLLLLGDCLWTDYRFPEALDAWSRAAGAATGADQRHALLLAARRLFSLGRFEESAAAIELARTSAPDDPELLRMLAELRERQGRATEAEPLARAAIAVAPGERRSVRALALILRRLGRTNDAIALLHESLRRGPNPDDWRLHIELAAALDAAGDFPAAMAAMLASRDQLRPLATPAHARWQRDTLRREALAAAVTAADLRQWRAAPRDGSFPEIALLAGHPRSGTTLLEHLLSASPHVRCTDETGVLHREFIRPITLEPATSAAALNELRAFDCDQLADGRAFYRRATEAHLGGPLGDALLIEKDPFLTQDLLLPVRLLPEASVIMPLRDPRDVALSFFFTIVPLAGDSTAALDLESAVQSVALSLRLWKHWKTLLPQPWLEVRYESLVAAPQTVMADVWRFLGLAPPPAGAAPDGNRGVRTPSYSDVSRPVHQRAVGRWRNYAPWLEPVMDPLLPLLDEFAPHG